MGINDEVDESFLESDLVKSAKSQMVNEFEHMIKFVICKHNQDADWIKSIRVASKFLSKLSKSETNKVKVLVDDLYNDGRNQAYKHLTSGDRPYKWFTGVCLAERPSDWEYDLISNPDKMNDWMKENARSENVKNRLGIKDGIFKYNDTNASYDIKSAFPGIKK